MKPIIKKVEYDIIDHCNLNCNYCIHNSQFKTHREESVEFIVNDLKYLFDRFDIGQLVLKGGEPTLHSNISGVLLNIKNIVGNTKLTMVTNGLKMLSMPDSFFLAAKMVNLYINLSKYPTGIDYDKIKAKMSTLIIFYVPVNAALTCGPQLAGPKAQASNGHRCPMAWLAKKNLMYSDG